MGAIIVLFVLGALILVLVGMLVHIMSIGKKADQKLVEANSELAKAKSENIIQTQAVEIEYRKKLEVLETNRSDSALQTQAIEIEHKRKTEALIELDSKIKDKIVNIQTLEEDYAKLLNQKKSSEVRLGKIAENMAPFFTCWPYDPNTFRFLGNPVDGIQFTEDEIIFVEIKTGKARLSDSQKWIKKLVQEKKVSFVSFKIGENGVTLEKEE